MNKIERLKTAKDGLDIKPDIQRFAKEGWGSIGEDDIERLKWYGVYLRKPTPGFFMLRVRIPNGHTHSYQVRTHQKNRRSTRLHLEATRPNLDSPPASVKHAQLLLRASKSL